MILEIAILNIIAGREADFEQAFQEAKGVISAMPGFLGLELQRCLEESNQYALLVRWETVQDHTQGFRNSASYAQWKELLHHLYDPFPEVAHYRRVT